MGRVATSPESTWRTDSCPIEDLPALAKLAGEIWRVCYPPLIGSSQVEYMLERMYSLRQLEEDLASGIRFLRLWSGGEWVGFAAVGEAASPAAAKLHKLYVRPEFHGAGGAQLLLRAAEKSARLLGAGCLVLAVNKRNDRARAFYQKSGFHVYDEVVVDIGGGHVMDDFLMRKDLDKDLA